MLRHRKATSADAPLLAEMNHQLIRDEGHRNPMTVLELEARMRDWLTTAMYEAVIFEDDAGVAAYALYRNYPQQVYLRHFFVARDRRRRGVGRAAIQMLRDQVWPRDRRLLVEVLWHNASGIDFWKAVGFHEYSLALEIMPDGQ